MPINKIVSTKRGKAAIAAIMSAATMISGVWYVKSGNENVPAAVALASTSLVRPWEGRQLKAYLDRVAKPPVWTICDGDTKNVKPGMVETAAGCDYRLKHRMTAEFYPALKRCIAGFEKKPVSWQAMMLSLSWNVGTSAACGSTAAKLGRVGQYYSSCLAATAWNKAGGHVVIGLVRRRENGDASRIGEAELCVSGID